MKIAGGLLGLVLLGLTPLSPGGGLRAQEPAPLSSEALDATLADVDALQELILEGEDEIKLLKEALALADAEVERLRVSVDFCEEKLEDSRAHSLELADRNLELYRVWKGERRARLFAKFNCQIGIQATVGFDGEAAFGPGIGCGFAIVP